MTAEELISTITHLVSERAKVREKESALSQQIRELRNRRPKHLVEMIKSGQTREKIQSALCISYPTFLKMIREHARRLSKSQKGGRFRDRENEDLILADLQDQLSENRQLERIRNKKAEPEGSTRS